MVRSILRNIARNRMKDMGMGNVNQKMHQRFGDKETMPGREMIAKLKKTSKGREVLARRYKEHPAMWMEVLCGSRKNDADEAFRKASFRRFVRRHPDKVLPPKRMTAEEAKRHGSQKVQTV